MGETSFQMPMITPEGVLDSLKKKVHNLSFLHEISHRINTIQNREELMQYVLNTALTSLSSRAGSIFLWNENTEQLCLHKVIGNSHKELEGITQRLGEGVAGLVAKEKRPVLVKNVNTDPRFSHTKKGSYVTDSFLCVPMIARNKLVGVINVTEKENNTPFNYDELEFLFILANHVGIAIDNVDLYEKVMGFNRQLEDKVHDATQKLEKIIEHSLILQHYKEDILESLTTGIYVLDQKNRITLWNRGMELKYRLRREDVLGKHFFEVLAHLKPDHLVKAIQNVHHTGKQVSLEGVCHRFSGAQSEEECVINYKVFPLQTENREHRGVVVLLDDVTERIKMEQALRTNERLAAIGKLSSGIAHELNNPLDGTRRYLNLSLEALERGETQQSSDFVKNAREGINRMIKIVRSLLDFSHKTRHAVPITVNVNDVLRETIRCVKKEQLPNRVILSANLPDVVLPVADFGLQTVFSNLIKNAIDAIPGDGKISVFADRCVEHSIEYAHVRIADTGVGISSDVLSKIFEPFFTTKKMGEGTGLGLAICHEIVARAGGSIRVASQEGKGSEFVVALPIARIVKS